MTQWDGEADGQRARAVQVSTAAVDRCEYRENQHEGDDQLHSERLFDCQSVAHRGHAQRAANGRWRQQPEKAGPGQGTAALGGDEEQAANEADASRNEEGDRDGRVDMTSATYNKENRTSSSWQQRFRRHGCGSFICETLLWI